MRTQVQMTPNSIEFYLYGAKLEHALSQGTLHSKVEILQNDGETQQYPQ